MSNLDWTNTTRMAFKKLLWTGAAAALVSACGGDPADMGDEEPLEAEEAAIFGSDACRNVDIEIDNDYVVSGSAVVIKVLKVEYYSASEAKWYTENLADDEVATTGLTTWTNEDLQYAENDLLTQFKIHFKYKEFDGDWSDTVVKTDNIADKTCLANSVFRLTVR